VLSPDSVESIEYTDAVEDKILRLLDEVDGLALAIRAMDRVLRKNPEDEATNSIEGKPGVHYFAREPGENPGVPGVTLLYTVEPDRVVV
jgi:hypothetical protein